MDRQFELYIVFSVNFLYITIFTGTDPPPCAWAALLKCIFLFYITYLFINFIFFSYRA